ncbi:DUF4145 domain-containing protein [Acetobacter pasteurianus]|uniref:DUF4145 domain-containing protein n=1 Tax=Acetobacter pasteurianus subsp. pasteurianus TaxID=481145 RepID=A0AAC9SQ50_ACEPA|nr:DUF4145 domain-containing protein [Acetobacter pasteurianus]ASC05223.1 hypothetical protein S101468_00956 [Acetobacter pasteurianus subsp. pasteurianus]
MATIALDCPRCTQKNITMDISGYTDVNGGRSYNIACFCRGCSLPVGMKITDAPTKCLSRGTRLVTLPLHSALNQGGDITSRVEISDISPPPPKPTIPLFLPDNVERAFIEGERSRISGNVCAAGMTYRRSLELATKDKARDIPGASGKSLAVRIRILAENQLLTPDIRDWADHIRIIGNESAHDEDEPSPQEIADLGNLTRMMLVYLYELSGQVQRMKGEEAKE